MTVYRKYYHFHRKSNTGGDKSIIEGKLQFNNLMAI